MVGRREKYLLVGVAALMYCSVGGPPGLGREAYTSVAPTVRGRSRGWREKYLVVGGAALVCCSGRSRPGVA
ncbi:hypothetical protein GCM10009559_60890 [Pseudonocardia zijingensis]|uniref:Secreted protein n=1 Tax=Pseudonocardia zijingensis TaxID=153376 RepID=A0ABN1N997_9PSEU